MNIAHPYNRGLTETVGECAPSWPIDIEVTERLVARIRPLGERSEYEIHVGTFVDGEVVLSGEPFSASFGPEFDLAVHVLRASPRAR